MTPTLVVDVVTMIEYIHNKVVAWFDASKNRIGSIIESLTKFELCCVV